MFQTTNQYRMMAFWAFCKLTWTCFLETNVQFSGLRCVEHSRIGGTPVSSILEDLHLGGYIVVFKNRCCFTGGYGYVWFLVDIGYIHLTKGVVFFNQHHNWGTEKKRSSHFKRRKIVHDNSQMLHVWYICLHNWGILMVNGKPYIHIYIPYIHGSYRDCENLHHAEVSWNRGTPRASSISGQELLALGDPQNVSGKPRRHHIRLKNRAWDGCPNSWGF